MHGFVIIRAVTELWQREIGEPDRDLAAEIDEIRARLDVLDESPPALPPR